MRVLLKLEPTFIMEETMQRLQGRFQAMSDHGRKLSFTPALDEMGTRIDDLENNVSELMTQAGVEEQAASK
uniref:Uncharacterized protein n=1 Tax=Gasterosteus aculeatus aculeatus TaxID=481459 RepID=A0AAQ4S742_GASAC